jgi:hypothetical protein
MPVPKSLTQPLRQGQLNVGSGWRVYFAPFNLQTAVTQSSTSLGPTMYDLVVTGKFIDAPPPPAGWFDLGLIDKFKMTPGSKIGNIMTGYRGVTRAKYRAETAEKCNFVCRESSHMMWKIASGSQTFNILATASGHTPSTIGPLSSSGTPAIPMGATGYQPTGIAATATAGYPTLFVPSGSGALFPAGSYIVCDQDYTGGYGFIGDAGANLFQNALANNDVDFIRKTSDYVSGVKSVVPGVAGQDALILTGPFVGGGNSLPGATPFTAPSAGAKVQAIQGFIVREGGTYIKEWSMVAVLDTLDYNQIMMYYPRIAPDSFSGIDAQNLQNATSISEQQLVCSFDALGFDDPYDGETVVRYLAWWPSPSGLNIQI